ncbi:MAG: hypothetical protein WDO19_07130 [Bacteroidota bacterium]
MIYLVVFIAGISVSGFAQPYQKGIGARISLTNAYYDFFSVSYKFFLSEASAIELNGGFGLKSYYYYNGTTNSYSKPFTPDVSASYQYHFEIPVRGGGLYWFVGGGLTAYRAFSSFGDHDGFGFGLFPTGGVDFKIPRIPLAVSADYRPTFFVTRPDFYDGFYGTNFGVSARYTIGEK